MYTLIHKHKYTHTRTYTNTKRFRGSQRGEERNLDDGASQPEGWLLKAALHLIEMIRPLTIPIYLLKVVLLKNKLIINNLI